jgi:hypothetical protein
MKFLITGGAGSVGQIFSLATIYLGWEAIAGMIIRVTGSSSRLDVIPAFPPGSGRGAQFLADPWELSSAKAERCFGYRPASSPLTARQKLENALAAGAAEMKCG